MLYETFKINSMCKLQYCMSSYFPVFETFTD